MKNLQQLVYWTRIALITVCVVALLTELCLGVIVIDRAKFRLDFNFGMIAKIILGGLIFAELIVAMLLYKSRVKYIQLLDKLEDKIIAFTRIYLVRAILFLLAGFTSLLGYVLSENLLWLFPWMIVLYMFGKAFPFRLNLFHEMNLIDQKERDLFYKN